jgi:ADP-heptose:LPS heptosyltransferase
MNVTFQRAVDRWVGAPACALLSLLDRLRGPQAAASPPRRILVILLSEMGSMVLARPMFVRLRRRYPEASLYVLSFARNREMIRLLAVVPEANIVALDDRSAGSLARDCFGAVRRLRALRLDAVIDCELFARVSSLFSRLSGAPVRAGFHRLTQEGLYRGSFINRPVLYNPYRHLTFQYLTLAAALDSTTVPVAKDAPEPGLIDSAPVAFPEAELRAAADRLEADFPAVRDRRLVLINPGGGLLPIRAWPLEHYRELCLGLIADGFVVGVIGLAGDRALGQSLAAAGGPGCLDLTGYTTSLRHLLALFHRADLLVTNDGGPGQFAALTPIQSIIFFGPETPLLYGPMGGRAHFFHTTLPCSPCLSAYNHRNSPCDGDNQCLKRIAPAAVLAKARALLALAPAEAPALAAPAAAPRS